MLRLLSGTALLAAGLTLLPVDAGPFAGTAPPRKLIPRYPADRDCSPITSLFASFDDVDGRKRDERHSGIDAGRLGDPILAPAPGAIVAAWRADWGWGPEGALMIRHTKADLGLDEGPDIYYSEFDHLRYDEIAGATAGRRVARGETLAHVFRPGGDPKNLPEVHWEVWSIEDDAATVWERNAHHRRSWSNETGRLVDPLSMLALQAAIRPDGSAPIAPFDRTRDYRGFRGFTYILPCPPAVTR